jgi:hypothetical protein
MRRLFVSFVFLASCEAGIGGPVCSEIGCTDELTLQFHIPGGGDVVTDLVATIEAGADTYTIDCVGVGNTEFVDCEDALVHIPAAPALVTISATSAEGTFEGEIEPDYDVWHPNGGSCPPECLDGTETVEVIAP